MKKLFFFLAAIFNLAEAANAQKIQDIRAATAFLYFKTNDNHYEPEGTCFFVGIPVDNDSTRTFIYLVTAKHVIQNKQGLFYNNVWLRLNYKGEKSDYYYVNLAPKGKSKYVYFNKNDTTAEIAVVPYKLDLKNLSVKFLNTSFLSNREEFKKLPIEEGRDVFFTGLFTDYYSDQQVEPIVRFGKIALMPKDSIEFLGKKRDMILLECSVYGGNSGSPVYFKLPSADGKSNFLILGGIVNGHYKAAATSDDDPKFEAVNNNGIALITPIYHLTEILYGDELSKLRQNK